MKQKNESQYTRSLIEASLDPLVTINTKGKITDMNQALANITGKSRKELTGTDFFDYFTQPQEAGDVYKEVFAKGSVIDMPLTLRHTTGKLTEVLFNGSVYKDDLDAVQGVVIVARDVTEKNRIAHELVESKLFAERASGIAASAQESAEIATEMAENSLRAKQQFLSNMSHEIRTPMNAIIGFTKVVLKTDLSVKQHEYLTAIKVSGDALIVLINDILDLAKVDAGKMTFEKIPFRMASSISAMLHLFETKIQEKNLELVKIYDPRIPEVLEGDPVRLHQIILNLVSNSVKFTNQGSITMKVQLIEQNAKTVSIRFSVKDTGIGISEEKLDKIFENFQQASSNTSRLYGGTGLGLAIVKQLVEAQNGTIKVESTLDEGSEFSFVLSFLKTISNPGSEIEVVSLDPDIKDLKVLVVEDIALNQLLMKTLLEDFDFECVIAKNGMVAIEKLKEMRFDIVLMDLQMPVMNGFEATEHIRNVMHLDIPIIALTADVTTVDLEKCKAVGMNDYIAKPVDERLLYNKIIGSVAKKNSIHVSKEKMRYIDLKYLNTRTKSNPELMSEMISLYLQQTPPLIETMKKGFKDKDWSILSAAAHKMIPSFSIIGMSADFENMARRIQEFASSQEQNGTVLEMVLKIEEACNQACKELEEELIMIKKQSK